MSPQVLAVLAGLLSLLSLFHEPVEPEAEAHHGPEHMVDLLTVLPWV